MAQAQQVLNSYGWTPAELPNLWAWFDASDVNTITLGGGSNVTQMSDKSGLGHHAVQANATKQMLQTLSAINGRNCIKANAALTSNMTFTAMACTGQVAAFFVGAPNSPGVNSPEAFGNTAGGFGELAWGSLSGAGGGPRIVGSLSASLVLSPGNTTPPLTIGPVIRGSALSTAVSWVWNGTNFNLYQDGVLAATTTGTIGTANIDQIGYGAATGTPNTFMWAGNWGEGILVKGAISAVDKARVDQWLRVRWGTL